MKLAHIGIAVKALAEQLSRWQKCFDLNLKGIEEIKDQNLKVAMMELGDINIELLEPLDPASPIHKFIENRGEGLHHICITVDNIESALAQLRSNGVRLIDEKPRIGAAGKKIAFVHPKDLGGVLIELSE